jgi:hypothetical protein
VPGYGVEADEDVGGQLGRYDGGGDVAGWFGFRPFALLRAFAFGGVGVVGAMVAEGGDEAAEPSV